jgi:hypothetical protein
VSTFDIDSTALRGIAANLRTYADTLPKTPVLDLAGAGSPTVASAAESFNLWAVVTGTLVAGKLEKLATDAEVAATAFENLDENTP